MIISYEDFLKVEIRVGKILDAKSNPKARKPSYILRVDFGEFGVRTTSAQITDNYEPADVVGLQVLAVTNFPPKKIAGVRSEVLVLAAVSQVEGTVLIGPMTPVKNGTKVL